MFKILAGMLLLILVKSAGATTFDPDGVLTNTEAIFLMGAALISFGLDDLAGFSGRGRE